jgi:hypothetical protein
MTGDISRRTRRGFEIAAAAEECNMKIRNNEHTIK